MAPKMKKQEVKWNLSHFTEKHPPEQAQRVHRTPTRPVPQRGDCVQAQPPHWKRLRKQLFTIKLITTCQQCSEAQKFWVHGRVCSLPDHSAFQDVCSLTLPIFKVFAAVKQLCKTIATQSTNLFLLTFGHLFILCWRIFPPWTLTHHL